jgi:hypothetical protein
MNLLNFMVWLSAGAIIGWFAREMVEAEHRRIQESVPDKDSSSE